MLSRWQGHISKRENDSGQNILGGVVFGEDSYAKMLDEWDPGRRKRGRYAKHKCVYMRTAHTPGEADRLSEGMRAFLGEGTSGTKLYMSLAHWRGRSQ